jgi:U6 snRNA-associated Sm-like protein LSm2
MGIGNSMPGPSGMASRGWSWPQQKIADHLLIVGWMAESEKNAVFQRMFKKLIGNPVIVELKNQAIIKGILQSSDNFLNMKLIEVEVLNAESFPHLPRLSSAFVRGSSIRYVHLPPEEVNVDEIRAISRGAS